MEQELLSTASTAVPRFRRGARQMVRFINLHLPEDDQIDERGLYKLISRGTIRVGRDGRNLIATEDGLLEDLKRAASPAEED
jgi:hypothetical protein